MRTSFRKIFLGFCESSYFEDFKKDIIEKIEAFDRDSHFFLRKINQENTEEYEVLYVYNCYKEQYVGYGKLEEFISIYNRMDRFDKKSKYESYCLTLKELLENQDKYKKEIIEYAYYIACAQLDLFN